MRIGELRWALARCVLTIPLDAWIDQTGLREFVKEHLEVHLGVFFETDKESLDGAVRCVMISLRQELREAGWTPPTTKKREDNGYD